MNTPAGQLIVDHPQYTVRFISVSEMDNNVYLLTSKQTGQQVLIDAADNFERIHEFVVAAAQEDVSQKSAPLSEVLTTHGHWDHIRALPQVVSHFSATPLAGEQDAAEITQQEGVAIQHTLVDGEKLNYDAWTLQCIHLTGHTPGSIAFVLDDDDDAYPTVIFSGDSLFPGGVGKTNSPEDFKNLLHDVKTKIFDRFDDSTVVLPGHGKATTLGADRGNLSDWEERGW
ncbi:MAG: MBL fold metallo-hydrolase [Rothia sp. (in: high G+C Gram-positive bacteria)]|nr:MBL fold metallo-hydrolase [Rothia sp. (in: high G+C Gram-positive bacteria)]